MQNANNANQATNNNIVINPNNSAQNTQINNKQNIPNQIPNQVNNKKVDYKVLNEKLSKESNQWIENKRKNGKYHTILESHKEWFENIINNNVKFNFKSLSNLIKKEFNQEIPARSLQVYFENVFNYKKDKIKKK